MVVWDHDVFDPNAEIEARIGFRQSSSAHAYGTSIKFDEASEAPTKFRALVKPSGFAGAEHLIIFFEDENDQPGPPVVAQHVRAITADLSVGYEAKGLGISIGKGAGDRVYVTVWDGFDLYLVDYDLPTLDLFDSYNLGAASATDFARPFAGYGDDNHVVVYGLMNDPYFLGTPTYVLESTDGGFTAALVPVDGTWTAGSCSALWMEPDGFMYAIRNLGTSSKLYYGNAVVNLSLMSTLTFPAGVNPHAIKVDPFDLSVYAGAATAQGIMVIKSFPLYANWINMTFDHGVASDIVSLELL